ncbi:MAG: SRPBCC family protein [Planctomycetales bacterium]
MPTDDPPPFLPRISRHPTRRGTYLLETDLWLPHPPEIVFAFFSVAFNLEGITPAWLRFHVLTPRPIEMHTGTLLDYRLRLHGLPIRWRTRIAHWNPPWSFVDEQLRGPYRLWYHEHQFEAADGGTRILDRVTYIPRGGSLLHRWLVKPDLERIFTFRQTSILARFCPETPLSRD